MERGEASGSGGIKRDIVQAEGVDKRRLGRVGEWEGSRVKACGIHYCFWAFSIW